MERPLPSHPHSKPLLVAALAYAAFAVYGSFVPLQFRQVSFAAALDQFSSLPPPAVGLGNRADWGSNVLLFIPLTFLWMGTLTCNRTRVARYLAAAAVLPAAAAFSVAIEFGQIWFSGRTPSLSDISAESLGGAVGILLWLVAGPHVAEWLRDTARERPARVQYQWMLELYLVGLVGYSLVPLDLTMSLTELYHKYTSGFVVVVPFGYHYDVWSTAVYQFSADVLEFVPVGAWVALTQQQRWPHWSALKQGLVGGALIALAIEFTQLLVMSRFTDTTDIVLGTAGAAIGGWLVGRYDPQVAGRAAAPIVDRSAARATPWLGAIAVYSLLLIVGFLFPFDFRLDPVWIRPRLDSFFRVPFFALYWGSVLNATSQLLIRLLLYAPLGLLWARLARALKSAAVRKLIVLGGIAYAAVLALGIELVQIAMPSKVADATEVFICTAGALAGYLLNGSLTPAAPLRGSDDHVTIESGRQRSSR